MPLQTHIQQICEAIRAGRFANEAAVSQGVVLRLLAALSWPAYDTDIICPEFSLSGRRVDFALCHPPRKPIAFIEVKQIGQSDGAERQLFEYAFHAGIPMAILTDGQEWNFFLPGEQGDYGERRVYKLDLLERDINESAERLTRYLSHENIISGRAIENARSDYKSISKQRQIENTLPQAWRRLVSDEDEMLLQLLADRVESICGFKPEPDVAARFLRQISGSNATKSTVSGTISGIPRRLSAPLETATVSPTRPPDALPRSQPTGPLGFRLDEQFYPARTAIDALRQTFEVFQKRDPSFFSRFAALPRHGRSRRYLASNRDDLYAGRPDLCIEFAIEISPNWWLGTNHSKSTIKNIIYMACDVSNIKVNQQYEVNIGD
jgi:hypothetical protein